VCSTTERIRMLGRIKNGWSDYLSGLQEALIQADGATIIELTGTVPDQPALFGLLSHIRNLGLPLISVEYLENSGGE